MKKALRITLTLLLSIIVFAASDMGSFAASKPGKVKGLSAKAVSSSSITLKWKKVKGAKGYQIYKVTKKGRKKIATVKGASKKKYTLKNLKSGTKYSFKIRAFNKKKKFGPFSKKVSAKTSVKPGQVLGLTAKEVSAGSVCLTWKSVKGASGYEVYRVTEKNIERLAAVKGNLSLNYTAKNLKRGLVHRFKVRAFNNTNEYGALSKIVSIRLNKSPTVLLILDGFGLSEKSEHNAIAQADTPVLDKLMKECPFVKGNASGLAVGLPEGQMGSSEVGHLNIGAGRVVDQELVRISKEIENGNFYKNDALLTAVKNVKEKGKSLHIYGLLSDGGVHSHNSHLYALLNLARRNGLEKVYVHCFLDGRDTPPDSGKGYVEALQDEMDKIGCGKIATVGGRYYAMDRDNNWDRIEKAYRAMTLGEGVTANSAVEAVTQSYEKGDTDEFVLPTVVMQDNTPVATIDDGDSIIFFNFRPDRAKEITRAFCCDEFDGFERGARKQVSYVCFTDYDPTIPNKEIAFEKTVLTNTFGEWLSGKGLKQARIAETEKYAHVTSFFNGGVEKQFEGEDRFLIPSPKVATYDLQPEMSIEPVCDTLTDKIHSGKYDVIVANFANADMVGHTGVETAAIKAVTSIDKCIGRVVKAVEETDGQLFICADHGNAEMMVDYETGKPMTAHTTNPVPFILVNYDPAYTLREGGCLADIAPTLIEMMGMKKPAEMTGQSLLIKK